MLAGLGVFVLVVVLGLGVAWWRLEGNISRLDVSKDLGTRPTAAAGPLNILLIGSDNREGEGVPGASLTRAPAPTPPYRARLGRPEHVTVVSVPRDSMVPAPPNCTNSTPKDEWVVQQWNAMFSIGGPACLITTIEGNTGLRMDHFAVVDFRGFRDMVDALGGVPICAPEAIDDPKAKLKLSGRRHVLDGTQALGYVRARKTLGDGSDLGRIARQQAFLSSVVQEATRTSLLLRPDKLFGFLDAATKSLTTDEQFDLGTMKDLASSVKAHRHQRTSSSSPCPCRSTRPTPTGSSGRPAPTCSGRPCATTAGGAAAKPTRHGIRRRRPAADREPDADRGRRRQRHRGAGPRGAGGRGAGGAGLPDATTSSTTDRPNGVVVEYGPGQKEAARTVAAAFEGADPARGRRWVTSGVRVVLGRRSAAVQEIPNRTGSSPVPTPSVSAPAPAPTPTITTRTADQDICS